MKQTFKANRPPKAFIPIIIGFAILLSPVIPLLFSPPAENEFQFGWLALIPIAIFGFMTYVLIASSLKMFVSYTIFDDGITIYKPPFHKRTIMRWDIESVIYATPEETRQQIEDIMMEQNSYGESADLVGFIQMLKRKSPAFRYYTIVPQATVTTVGPKETITSLEVKPTDGSIILKLKSEEVFFLTPQQPIEFKEAFEQQ